MELSLERLDLHQVQTTSRKTTRLLPSGKKRQQKVVVADETGSILCFSMKKDAIEKVFVAQGGKEASRVELGGDARENVFVASSGTVRAYSKKGKEFLRFNTNLSEPIHSMWVGEEDIHTGGEYMYNQFVQCKDTYFFMSNDRINDLTCEKITESTLPSGGRRMEAILACHDRLIRVITGNDLLYEAAMGGPVLTVERYSNARLATAGDTSAGVGSFGRFSDEPAGFETNKDGRYKELVFGTENGMVGQLLLDNEELRRGWVIDPTLENRRGKSGGVQAIAAHDITRDGINDLMVGRDDGGLEIWSFDTGPQPKLVFEKALGESLTAVECGLVTNVNFEEVVCTTYSGKIMSFTSEPSAAEAGPESSGTAGGGGGGKNQKTRRERGERKIRELRDELEQLREKVERERERVAKLSPEPLVAADVHFKMIDRWALNAEEARYELHIELSMPIDTVLLQCDVPIELIDADTNSAIVSRTPSAAGGVLATYRCQEPTNRLQVCLRTSEGRYGSLQAYVWPRISPKTCRAATYPIKPLSLHTRLQNRPEELPKLNALKISGDFKLAEVHSWALACLPEVPARLQGEEASFVFRNTFLDTLLLADYKKGEAQFQSDSLTTLAIVKEVVTKEATARKIQIQISVDTDESTVTTLLRKLDPLLCYQLSLASKVKLIDTLKEVRMQEPDISFLAPEYVEILDNEELIQRELKEQPGRLQFLYSIVTDLYVDNHKFKGQNVTAQVPQLQRVLQDYSIEAVLGFFNR